MDVRAHKELFCSKFYFLLWKPPINEIPFTMPGLRCTVTCVMSTTIGWRPSRSCVGSSMINSISEFPGQIWQGYPYSWGATADDGGYEYDKIRPYHVRRKDTKDTVGRYIVLIPEVKVDSCQHDS